MIYLFTLLEFGSHYFYEKPYLYRYTNNKLDNAYKWNPQIGSLGEFVNKHVTKEDIKEIVSITDLFPLYTYNNDISFARCVEMRIEQLIFENL